MKFLLVGSFRGWMAVHLRQFSRGFEQAGHQILEFDYKSAEKTWNPLAKSEGFKKRRITAALQRAVNVHKPDCILFVLAHLKVDFSSVKDFFKGPLIAYDYDGPGWAPYQTDLSWIKDIDLLLTVSRVTQKALSKKNIESQYLPHGVDTEYYSPRELSDGEKELYSSRISFVGRPTKRRVSLLGRLPADQLTLWGRRWQKPEECPDEKLRQTLRLNKDVIGEGVPRIYSASDLMVNMLREPLDKPPTIMSLQVFAVPSCGTCLLTEWVEELEDAFEPGKELLAFKSPDEFAELAARYSKEPDLFKEIGENGRKRCLAEHSHQMRAIELVKLLD